MNFRDSITAYALQRLSQAKLGKWLLAGVFLWLTFGWVATAAETAGLAEYQVKAAYLYNFTKFTDWPASAFASPDAPIVIGIVGDDPFGNTLDEVVKGETVKGHPLVVKRLKQSDDSRNCNVLFICRSEKEQLPVLLQKLKGAPVLSVGDTANFTQSGGMVNFVLVQEKVKLEINQAAAEEAGLQISAKLLRLARIVKSN